MYQIEDMLQIKGAMEAASNRYWCMICSIRSIHQLSSSSYCSGDSGLVAPTAVGQWSSGSYCSGDSGLVAPTAVGPVV